MQSNRSLKAQHFKSGEASGSDEKVDFIKQKSGKSCSKCGTFHPIKQCPTFGKVYHSCNRPDHFKAVCKSKSNVEQKQRKQSKKRKLKGKKIYYVNDDSESSGSDGDELFIGMVKADQNTDTDEWSAKLKINGKNLKFKLDTGADCNVISKTLFEQIRTNEVIRECKTKLFAYNKEQIAVKGKVQLLSDYKGKCCLLGFKVVDIDSQALLGLNTCKELNLLKHIIVLNKEGQEASPNKKSQADKLIEEYDDVFNGLGNLGKHHIVIDKAVPPIVHPPRKVPFGISSKLKDTLKTLESTGVIAQMNGHTGWVNSLVIAEKKNGSLRLCLDPRDSNMAIKQEHYPVQTAQELQVI